MGRTLVLTDWAENLPSDWRNLLASSVFPRGMVGLGQCQRARNSEDGGKNATAFQHNCSIPNTGLLPPNWRKRGLGLRSTRNAKKRTQIESMQVGRVGRASHRPQASIILQKCGLSKRIVRLKRAWRPPEAHRQNNRRDGAGATAKDIWQRAGGARRSSLSIWLLCRNGKRHD